jgi:hypothetical protein
MNRIMTFNQFIAEIAENELIRYVQNNIPEMTDKEFDEEMNKYYAGEYKSHLHYLIKTWKNYIHEDDFKFDYDYEGTYDEVYDYYLETPFPTFDEEWLNDIFVRHILDTAVCLK